MARATRKSKSTVARAQEPETPEGQVRGRIKRYLVQRFYTRFHMSLILMSAGFAAMLTNWTLLHWGVTKMWMRYPVAVTLSYLTFLAGVWLWIQYVEFRNDSSRKSSLVDAGDLPDIGISGGGGSGGGSSVEIPNILRGGGGSFDGGGAGGSWTDVASVEALAANPAPSAPVSSGGIKDIFGGIGDIGDLDGDAVIVIVLAALLLGSVLLVSGYILWFAPDILSEAIFGATLAGSLARTAKRQDNEGWVMGVVKKTWWPFALVFAAAMAFAIFAGSHYPAAHTLGEALSAAIAG